MSEVFHLSYCCKNKQENLTIDMAKIQIKSENLTPLEGLFSGRGAIFDSRHIFSPWQSLSKLSSAHMA